MLELIVIVAILVAMGFVVGFWLNLGIICFLTFLAIGILVRIHKNPGHAEGAMIDGWITGATYLFAVPMVSVAILVRWHNFSFVRPSVSAFGEFLKTYVLR